MYVGQTIVLVHKNGTSEFVVKMHRLNSNVYILKWEITGTMAIKSGIIFFMAT